MSRLWAIAFLGMTSALSPPAFADWRNEVADEPYAAPTSNELSQLSTDCLVRGLSTDSRVWLRRAFGDASITKQRRVGRPAGTRPFQRVESLTAGFQTGINPSWNHYPILLEPYVPRITETQAQTHYGKRLLGDIRGTFWAIYQPSSGAPFDACLFLVDNCWDRLVYTRDLLTVRAWGRDGPVPAFDLRSPRSIDGNSGNWAAGDGYIDLFVAEFVPARLLHLQYHFQSNSITSVDSLTTDTDDLSYLIDCAINDMGTPGNPADDEVWVLDDPAGESVRLLLYKAGAAGIQQEISLSIPPGESTVPVPTSMTFGRALGYGDTRELYVLLKDGLLLQYYLPVGDSVAVLENSAGLAACVPGYSGDIEATSVCVDGYGQVYSCLTFPSNLLAKLGPDLVPLTTLDNPGYGDDQIRDAHGLNNPRPTIDAAAVGVIHVSETWSDKTGGQRYSLGIESALTNSEIETYSADLTYFATDPHRCFLLVSRSSGGTWVQIDSVDFGLRYSGASSVSWDVPQELRGLTRTYRFQLSTLSTYRTESNPDPAFGDTIVYTAVMGNMSPTVTEPLSVSLNCTNPCVYYMGDNEASISAQDEDSPGTLSFEWTSPTVVPTVLFQNPSTHAYMPSLSGPWSTVGMMVQIPAGRTSSTIPDFDDVSIEVLVQDGGGASIVAENSFYVVVAGNCSNCPASACDCARHADLNSDYFIDAADLAFLIDWVFFGVGPPATDPGCPHVDRGDFNCDGMDDATDISLMIDHVLFGGSPPCEPCDCAAYPTNCP